MNWKSALTYTLFLSVAIAVPACGGGGNAGGGGVVATPIAAPLPVTTPTVPPGTLAGGDDWATFAHDEQRTSIELQPTGLTKKTVPNLTLAWTYQGAAAFEASPIVVNGVVYAVTKMGLVIALDAVSGVAKWTYQLDDSDMTKMTPALYDGILFVGSQQNDPGDTNYSIIALDPQTGSQLWSQHVPGGLHGSPIAVNGTLYVPVALGDQGYCRAGGVYAFNEKTGMPGMSWVTSPGAQTDGGGIWSSLSYYGGSIFFGSGNTCAQTTNQANAIVSLNAALTPKWALNTAPALEDLDVGSTVLTSNGLGYAIGKNGTIYAVQLQNGNVAWSRYLGAPPGAGGFSTPAIAGQTLIVGGGYVQNPSTTNGPAGGSLFGLTLQGAVEWKISTASANLGYAAVTNDVAFVTLDQSIAAIDPTSGKIVWQYPTVGYHFASPVAVPSGLFDADESGRLYAFRLNSSTASAARSIQERSRIMALQHTQTTAFHRPPTFCKL